MKLESIQRPDGSRWLLAGSALQDASAAVVLLHGRGSSGSDIIRLAEIFPVAGVSFVAPSAAGGSWYPNRFLAPLARNEPFLSEGLDTIGRVVANLKEAGLPTAKIGWVGFSQGACLALEHVSRSAEDFAFVAALSGALMGPLGTDHAGRGLAGLPVLVGCAEADAHIPLEHVRESSTIFRERGAKVDEIIFPGSAHTLFQEEVDWLSRAIASL